MGHPAAVIAWDGWFDGACAPTNPGMRAIGALLIAPDGTEHTVSRSTGRGTSNEAEYQAMIALIELALSLQAPALRIFGDSQVVIYQVLGVYGVKTATLRPYHRQATALRAQLKACSLHWVKRELNSRADALAAAGIPEDARVTRETLGAGWGSLTDIGKTMGLSAVRVGRLLDEIGLRASDKQPTNAATEGGLASVLHNGFGLTVMWNVSAVVAQLQASQPSAMKR